MEAIEWLVISLGNIGISLLPIIVFVIIYLYETGLDEKYPKASKITVFILFLPSLISAVISSLYVIFMLIIYFVNLYLQGLVLL